MDPDPTSLNQMRDLALPESVSWWPLASGWWIFFGVFILWILVLVGRSMVSYRRNAYRRAGLKELAELESALKMQEKNGVVILSALSELLKRLALSAWPRETVASLTGQAWLRFLDETMGSDGFSEQPVSLLGSASFLSQSESDRLLSTDDMQQVILLSRRWIQTHKVT